MGRDIETIQAEISAHRAALAALHTRAAAAKHRVDRTAAAAWDADLARLGDLASELREVCLAAGAPRAASWDSDHWRSFTGDASEAPPLAEIRVGSAAEAELLRGEAVVHDVPVLRPFLEGSGALLLICDERSRSKARALLQSIVLRAAVSMPAEMRFTLIDPLGVGASFPFRASLGKVRPSGRSLTEELTEVVDDIRRINQAVVAHAERLLELTPDQRAGEPFEVVAVADFPKAFAKDPRAVEQLVRIGNSGPRAGRHLVMEVSLDQPLPHDFELKHFENAVLIDCRQTDATWDAPPSGAAQKAVLELAARGGLNARSGEWDSVVRPPAFFTGNSARRVETPVGERLRLWLGDDDGGKPSAHCMLAGQTGAGKSFFLHVIITGLAARYSPEELRFVLVDGKQGVEFEIYKDLPHADVVCLRTSPATARSVLEDFVAEMDDRYETFLRVGAVKLEDYRAKTGKGMPRKIMVVDEYQQLLDGDAERGGGLLAKILEKGRAAGTHLILGSQTFVAQGMPTSALTHVHLRVSLSLAQDYVQGLQVFGQEGKRMIRELAPSGQVVINDESGRDGANVRGAVARFTRENGRDPLAAACADIKAAAERASTEPAAPVVLSGRDAALLDENPWFMTWRGARPDAATLQTIARKPIRSGGFGIETWSSADKPLPLWLGRRFDVRGHALAVLRRGPAQNALVLGPHTDVRNMMLALSLHALTASVEPASLELLVVDGLTPGLPGASLLGIACESLSGAGVAARLVTRGSEGTAIEEFVDGHLAGRQEVTRVLAISEPEYLAELQAGADAFVPPTTGPAGALRRALTKGPQSGLHVIVAATGATALATILSPARESKHFNHRIVQQMNEDESMTLFASLAAARIADQAGHPHAALAVDMVRGVRAGVLFRSYSAERDIHAPHDEPTLRAAIERLSPRAR